MDNFSDFKRKSEYQKKVKELIVECCSSSTSHGIPNIVKTDKWIIKFMWFAFLMASTGFCGYINLSLIRFIFIF
jgi:hypothetical protein